MRAIPVIVTAVVVVVAALFIIRALQPEPRTSTTPGQETPSDITNTAAASSLELPVTLTKQFFSPSTVTVKKGDTLTLAISAVDQAHGIYSAATEENRAIAFGQTTAVVFTPEKTGTFVVVCNDGCDPGVQFSIVVQ